jgi:hypothetical protein
MGTSRVALALIVASACSSSPGAPAVDVEGGALIVMKEGDRLMVPLAVTPAIKTTPGYVVEPDANTPDGFATIDTSSGAPQLVLTASCSLVHSGQGDASISFVVRTDPTTAAAAAHVTVDVQGRDDGPCAPALRAWVPGTAGDCTTPPVEPTASRISFAENGGGQQLCVTAVAPDSAEQVALALASAGPADRIILAQQSAVAYTVGVDTTALRGLFDLDYTIDRATLGTEAGTITIEIGKPGQTSIDIDSTPLALTEFAVTSTTFRVFEYADPAQPGQLCVRATRTTGPANPLYNPKPFIKLRQIGTTVPARGSEWLSATPGDFLLQVSPFVDALPQESITIELVRVSLSAACASAVWTPGFPSTTLSANVTNMADMWSSPYDADTLVLPHAEFDPIVACADVDGDGLPEIVTATTPSIQPPHLNDPGFSIVSGEPGSQRLQVLETYSTANAPDRPTTLTALRWAGRDGATPTNLILAKTVGAGAQIQQLHMPGGTWVPAPNEFNGISLAGAVGLAQTNGAPANFVAFPVYTGTEWEIRIRCVSALCAAGESNYATGYDGPSFRLAAVNGNLAAAVNTGATTDLRSFTLLWDTATPPAAPTIPPGGDCVVKSLASSGWVSVAAVGNRGAAISEGQGHVAFGWHAGCGGGAITVDNPVIPDALGTAWGVAGVDRDGSSRLFVGTTGGMWEANLDSAGNLASWAQRDPVLATNALSGVQADIPQYGSGATSCIGLEGSFVTAAGEPDPYRMSFIWSRSDVVVDPL